MVPAVKLRLLAAPRFEHLRGGSAVLWCCRQRGSLYHPPSAATRSHQRPWAFDRLTLSRVRLVDARYSLRLASRGLCYVVSSLYVLQLIVMFYYMLERMRSAPANVGAERGAKVCSTGTADRATFHGIKHNFLNTFERTFLACTYATMYVMEQSPN